MNIENHKKIISNWLFFCCAMVAVMAVIGAITRLTESGLSIVEWRPLIGTLPPLSEIEWQRVFDLYRQTPEYMAKNASMLLPEFKNIFFWEWFHRLWGRLIGIVYALPLLFFWIKGWIPKRYKFPLLFGLFLGAGQAIMGWYMVTSGLVDMPDVSHYRLSAHLGLAFVIFGYLLWVALLLRETKSKITGYFYRLPHALIGLILLALTVIWGALTAGLEAGRIYNTWPLMSGHFLPPEVLTSLFENHAWVQFAHRWLAALTLITIFSFAWRTKDIWLSIAIMTQFILGIFTLISGLWIPLAAFHQLGALITFGLLVRSIYFLVKG